MAEPTTNIPRGSWILVTGANGFVASHVTQQFLQRGYKVRGTIRDLEKSAWLVQDAFKSYADRGDFELVVVSDLAAKGAFDGAIRGVSVIVHVASITNFSPDPNEVIPQTIVGATSLLHAALKEQTVKAFVYTGSIAASVLYDSENSVHVEQDTWNEGAVKLAWAPPPYDPSRGMSVYQASKAEAEKAVLKFFAEENPHFSVNCVDPSSIMGEPLNKKHLETPYSYLKVLCDGNLEFLTGIPSIIHIDVKDVALLHVAAALDPEVNGVRLQAWAENCNWNDILVILRKLYPQRKFIDDLPVHPPLAVTTDFSQPLALLKKWGHQDGWKSLEETVADNMKNIVECCTGKVDNFADFANSALAMASPAPELHGSSNNNARTNMGYSPEYSRANNDLLTCVAMAMVLLGQYAGVNFRQNTTPVGASGDIALGYNSSAAAVNALFLMLNIFGINTLRAARPVFNIPAVGYNIFVLLGFTYGPQMTTVASSVKFSKELFYSFLTGQAIGIVFANGMRPSSKYDIVIGTHLYNQRAASLKSSSAALLSLGGKLRDDVVFAKREIAFGHFQSKHISEMHRLFMNILVPIMGFSTITDISERLNHGFCTDTEWLEVLDSPEFAHTQDSEEERGSESIEWSELIQPLHASLKSLWKAKSKPKKPTGCGTDGTSVNKDIEKGAGGLNPGDIGFGDFFSKTIDRYRAERTDKLKTWAAERGHSFIFQDIQGRSHLPPDPSHRVNGRHETSREERFSERLHLIFYVEYLIYTISKGILALVRCAESKVDDGTLGKRRFVFPSLKTVTNLAKGLIHGESSSLGVDKVSSMGVNVQKTFGDRLRVIPKFFGSGPVKFGARVAIASMSIGVMAFLHQTHSFLIGQRVVWGMVIICLGMMPTTGSAVFILITNLGATVLATVAAFINWYIVGQKTAGIIVFLFFFLMIYFYFVVKYPRFLIAIASGAITHVLIVGYELQVRVEGRRAATATGQVFYEIYLLAPYRLLTVAGGVVVAYVFTIFPVPITEGSVLRKDLGVSLFLLANYVSSTTSTVDHRLQDKEGDMSLRSSPGRKLEKSRQDLLQKQLSLQNLMRQNLSCMDWGLNIGGEFPKEIYKTIIEEIQTIVNYLALIGFASETFIAARKESHCPVWLTEFAKSRPETSIEAHKTASLLILLSASVKNGEPLPPYLEVPTNSHLSKQVHGDKLDNITFENLDEPGFRALAVIKLAQSCVTDSLKRILGPSITLAIAATAGVFAATATNSHVGNTFTIDRGGNFYWGGPFKSPSGQVTPAGADIVNINIKGLKGRTLTESSVELDVTVREMNDNNRANPDS
ncbi:hypothetical protein V498_02242 [Pseudogymnoascus sp. VKM F-4517 (FW-2822)]|nr:hypothetical protein V498_02242 [Pseudogymnoascus sp. VKM F-4517 (FW-2822)]